MYYKKYFSGSVDATTTTNRYYMGLDKIATSTSLSSGHIKNRSDVLGNAIVSTLKDIGYTNAYWDSTSGYVFFDKSNNLAGFYLSVQSSYIYFNACGGTTDTTYITAQTSGTGCGSLSSGYSPFSTTGTSAATYQFYITIKGEPKGMMIMNIGTYSSPSSESNNLYICRGKDKRDNSDIIGFNFTLSSGGMSAVYFASYSTAKAIIATTLVTTRLSMSYQLVVLIPSFALYGFVFLDNTYFNPGITTLGFYKIGDDTYYVDDYWMTKCITTV